FDLNSFLDSIGALTVVGGSVTLVTGTLMTGPVTMTGGNVTIGAGTLMAGALTMAAGSIASTGAGKLVLQGSMRSGAATAPATISGNLDLGGATRIFTVADGAAAPDLDIQCAVANGGVTKQGAGTMR